MGNLESLLDSFGQGVSRYETWCLGVKRVKKFNVVLLGKWCWIFKICGVDFSDKF